METRTYQVFNFSELSDKAKQAAKDKHAELFSYSLGDEALNSIKKLAEHFGGRVKDYSIDWTNACSPSSMSFDMPEMDSEEIRRRLDSLGTFNPETLKGNGDCKLTGYCADEDAIDGFRVAFLKHKETDLEELMQEAFKTWIAACWSDYEAQYEDEEFTETADANGWMYTENGELD